MDEPGDVLQHEHEAILTLVEALEGMVDRIRTADEVPEADLGQALEVIMEFADRCHHGKEEEILFPALARASSEGAELTRRLTSDHKAMRKLVGVIRELLPRATDDDEARRQLAKNLATYPRLLREHIRIEDDRLLAETQRSLSPEERARVVREFERVEREEIGPGEHERYHALIQELADRYAS